MIQKYIRNKPYYATRHGGLTLNNELVTQEDVEPLSKSLGLPIPDTYRKLTEAVRIMNSISQKKYTANELFTQVKNKLSTLKVDTIGVRSVLLIRVTDTIIDTFDSLEITITTNVHGSFFMDRKDEEVVFRYIGLEREFDSIVAQLDTGDIAVSGREVLDRINQRLSLR